MPTLTSTGNVNLTSSTNWSPAQIPQAGDDLILNGAHTLTLDADMTLGSVLFQHVSARLAISGTTRSVGATNGWNFTVTPSAVLISTTLTTGMSVTLSGPWFANGNTANFQNGIAASTGGDLTLQTIGANPANILFDGAGTVWSSQRTLISSWSGGTLTTIGRFNWGNSSGTYTAVTMSGGTWTHTNTGTSLFGNQATATLFICSTGTVTVNWSGDVTFNTTGASVLSWSGTNGTLNIQNGSKWLRTGSADTGWSFQAGNYPKIITIAAAATGFTLNLDGIVCNTSTTRCVSIDMASSTGGRLNWRNQARTIASTDAVVLFFSNTITIDFTNLQISNAGKFQYFEVSTPTLVVDTLTTFTNTSMSAQASFISNTTTLDGKLVTLASNAPTLPTVAQVAAGTSYGYAATPLTGTGLIMDPATLATAMITSFSSLPEVMVRTTIATLASQTSFTLTAGSADDDVYNGLTAVITDQVTSTQKAVATVSDYVGSTRTVTLSAAPGFTIATGDSISIIAGSSSGGGGLDAAGVRAAVGLASANLDTQLSGISTKTTNLPTDPADASDIASSFSTVNSTLSTIAGYIDTEVSAIKAKTDNLPADPADASDIAAAIAAIPTSAAIADAVWDEEMVGHTTAGTYGGRIVRATNSNVAVQITGSNHISADVHAFQTDVIDATAFAASAVAEIQSGLATQSSLNTLTQYVDTEVAAIKSVTDKVDTMVEVDGLVYRYTTNALEQAPAGGGGGTDWTANERTAIRTILGIPGAGTTPADPSDGVLYDIKQKTDQIGSAGAITNLLAGAVLDPGTITSFPSELVIGDSYQETDGREIQIPLVDTDGNVLTTVGSRNLADATATFEIRRINESDSTRVITGVATIVDPPGTGTGAGAPYAIVELPADETAKGLVSYRYRGKLTLTWSGPGTDVYSFDTETIKFTY